MEQALLQAERWAEQEEVEAENQILSQLQLRLGQLNKAAQQEKDKVSQVIHANVAVFFTLVKSLFLSKLFKNLYFCVDTVLSRSPRFPSEISHSCCIYNTKTTVLI